MSERPQPVSFTIRPFCFETDYDPVISLWETAGPGVRIGRSDSPQEILKKLERDPDLFLVAESESGRLLGTVIGGFDGRRGVIYHLAVAPDARRQGLAAALMNEVESRLRAKGCLRSYLLVTQDNTSALEFYYRQGWSEMNLHILGKDIS